MPLCTSISCAKDIQYLCMSYLTKHKYVPDVFLFIQHMLILKQRKMIAARQNLYSLPIHLDYLGTTEQEYYDRSCKVLRKRHQAQLQVSGQ